MTSDLYARHLRFLRHKRGTDWVIESISPIVLQPKAGDNYAQIQEEIDAVAPNSGKVSLGSGLFLISQELDVPEGVTLEGAGGVGSTPATIIKLSSPDRSCISLSGPAVRINDISIDANRLGQYAVYGANHGRSVFDRVLFTNALKDGFFTARSGNNNANKFNTCWFFFNGTAFRSSVAHDLAPIPSGQIINLGGTVSITTGSITVTGSGTSFLTTDARAGDLIRIGQYFYEIEESAAGGAGASPGLMTDTSITLTHPARETISAQEYSVHVGDGRLTARHGDSNVDVYSNCHFRGNAGCGVNLNGGSGPHMEGGLADTHYCWGLRFGSVVNGDIVNGAMLSRPYFEGNVAGPIYAGFQRGLVVIAALHSEATDLVYNALTNTGSTSSKFISLYPRSDVLGIRATSAGMFYELVDNRLHEMSSEPYWTSNLLDDMNGSPNGRLVLPARGKESLGSIGAGGSTDVVISPPFNWRRFLSVAQNDAIAFTALPEGSSGNLRANVISRTTTAGNVSWTVRVYNDDASAQTAFLNWSAVM